MLVVLRCGRRWWTVEVHDDGAGDPQFVRECAAKATSFGLFSLVSDTARVGGRFWVAEAPALGGVRLSVSVPVATPRRRRLRATSERGREQNSRGLDPVRWFVLAFSGLS